MTRRVTSAVIVILLCSEQIFFFFFVRKTMFSKNISILRSRLNAEDAVRVCTIRYSVPVESRGKHDVLHAI